MIERITRAALKRTGPLSAPVGSVLAVRTDQPQIVLTFDDGPDPATTPDVLDALAAHGASATFFVLTGRARRHPDLVRRVIEQGHEVALHGVDHLPLPGLSEDEVRERTTRGREELERLTGAPVRWLRPPYGRQTMANWRAVRRSGVEPVLWGATLWDARHATDDERISRATRSLGNGTILLAHDAIAGAEDGAFDGPAPVVDRGALVDRLLTLYRERDLVGVSLARALQDGTAVRRAWFSS